MYTGFACWWNEACRQQADPVYKAKFLKTSLTSSFLGGLICWIRCRALCTWTHLTFTRYSDFSVLINGEHRRKCKASISSAVG